jgi:precorrin-6B methylase 2
MEVFREPSALFPHDVVVIQRPDGPYMHFTPSGEAVDDVHQTCADYSMGRELTHHLCGRGHRRPGRVLLLGLGGGAIVAALVQRFPDVVVDAVEIDAVVVAAARANFKGWEANTHVHVADANTFVRACRTQYDVVVIDIYSDAGNPTFHCDPDWILVVLRLAQCVVVNIFNNHALLKTLTRFRARRFGNSMWIHAQQATSS